MSYVKKTTGGGGGGQIASHPAGIGLISLKMLPGTEFKNLSYVTELTIADSKFKIQEGFKSFFATLLLLNPISL